MTDMQAERARSQRLIRMNEGLREVIKTIPKLNRKIALLDHERKRLRCVLKTIAAGTCATQPYAACPGCYVCIARTALDDSAKRQAAFNMEV